MIQTSFYNDKSIFSLKKSTFRLGQVVIDDANDRVWHRELRWK